MRDIDDMHQQVRLTHLIQSRFKRFDQLGRQLADKADRVGQQERQVVDNHLADGRVERRKQFVFGKHFAFTKLVHQRGLSDIGITDQGHANHLSAVLPLHAFLLIDLDQIPFQFGYLIQDNTLIRFQLRLTRTAHTDTATLTLQVCPQTGQAGQHIFILRQFHLRLCMCCLRTPGEDIQNQIRTVQNLHLQLFLDVTQLLGGKFVVEYHQPDLIFHHIFLYFLQLAGTDKGHRIRIIQFLIKTLHSLDTCRIGQESQFIQVFLHFLFILFRSNQPYENSLFCLCFRYNKFFHTAKIVNSIIYVYLYP